MLVVRSIDDSDVWAKRTVAVVATERAQEAHMNWRVFAAVVVFVICGSMAEAQGACPGSWCSAGGPCDSSNCVLCEYSIYLECDTCIAKYYGLPWENDACGCSSDETRPECCGYQGSIGYCRWCGGQSLGCCCYQGMVLDADGTCAPSPWEPRKTPRSETNGIRTRPREKPTALSSRKRDGLTAPAGRGV
jgi:hypothetical protein